MNMQKFLSGGGDPFYLAAERDVDEIVLSAALHTIDLRRIDQDLFACEASFRIK